MERRVLRRGYSRYRDRGLKQPSGLIGVQQERTELLAEPEGSVVGDLDRLRVEVESGEPASARRCPTAPSTARGPQTVGTPPYRVPQERKTGIRGDDHVLEVPGVDG